ncbi:heat shock 70 kDa protein 16-like isoform X3 [Vicia villosa]|nr:heat shock 70 kDa protein 16-like isoform X3 [Vicia villosa]XP_058724191.1 heat shock 70 kDa protein 16-like isoform X3 [Vicia villosa]
MLGSDLCGKIIADNEYIGLNEWKFFLKDIVSPAEKLEQADNQLAHSRFRPLVAPSPRKKEVQDVSSFSYGLALDEGPISVGSSGVIFPKGQLIPSTAVLRLQRTSFFQLEAFHPKQYELPPGTFPKISSFMVCSL